MASERKRKSLDRYLSRCGVATRTEAQALIRSGAVEVNGRVITDPAKWVHPARDEIKLRGEPVLPQSELRVVVYNKTRGTIVTADDPEGRPTVVDQLPAPFSEDRSLRPVGRLDRASAGLLLFANDTGFAARLLDHDYAVPKTYRVKVAPIPSDRAIGHMRSGMNLGDRRRRTAPAKVTVERRNPKSAVLRFVLTEGRNRQIRRMAEKVGCHVEWLVRIRFGPVDLGDLAPGAAREATPDELAALVACAE